MAPKKKVESWGQNAVCFANKKKNKTPNNFAWSLLSKPSDTGAGSEPRGPAIEPAGPVGFARGPEDAGSL